MSDADASPQIKIQLQRIYIKEVTYKVPHAPNIFINADLQAHLSEPTFSLEFQVKRQALDSNQHEITLHAIVTAKTKNNTTSFTMDIQQSGIFMLEGFSEEQLPAIFNNLCVPQLYPYLCRTITDASIQAGFPPILLSPLSFNIKTHEELSIAEKGKVVSSQERDGRWDGE